MSQIPDPIADMDFDPDQPSWPKVVGGISLGLGILGVLCVGCGLAGMFMTPMMMQNAPGYDAANPPPFMKPSALQMVHMVLGTLASGLLIGAGALTLGRKPLGRTLHLVWAVVGALIGILGIFVQIQTNAAMQQWIRDNPDSPFSQGGGGQQMGLIIGIGCGLVMGLGWPIFCLVWFGLVKKHAWQMVRRTMPGTAPGM